jgi:hypothetical protein
MKNGSPGCRISAPLVAGDASPVSGGQRTPGFHAFLDGKGDRGDRARRRGGGSDRSRIPQLGEDAVARMHRGGSNPSWCFAYLENSLVDFVCSNWIILVTKLISGKSGICLGRGDFASTNLWLSSQDCVVRLEDLGWEAPDFCKSTWQRGSRLGDSIRTRDGQGRNATLAESTETRSAQFWRASHNPAAGRDTNPSNSLCFCS